jgi:tetratricopeptide (TPR) repeat protein
MQVQWSASQYRASKLSSLSPQLTLEQDVTLSQSLVWKRQRDYYVRRGLGAWSEDNVPNYITNNPFTAEIYARIVCGFMCDCLQIDSTNTSSVSPSTKFRILEFGAGPGKFAYLFLRQLTSQLRSQNISPDCFQYCMTDCSPSLLESWEKNEYLSTFLASGQLSFELLDLGEELRADFLRDRSAPLIAIANYVFDSLPQDAFAVKDGTILESVVTTSVPEQLSNDTRLSNLEFSFSHIPVRPNRYAEPEWNDLLKHYSTAVPGATVLFPVAALQTIRKLRAFSDGRLIVLAADKGLVHESDLLSGDGEPHFEFHQPNCFSQTVNFDAIARDCQALAGEALLPDKHSSNLSLGAFVFGLSDRSSTRKTYHETLAAFGVDDLFALMAWLRPHLTTASPAEFLAVLRLSRWDPAAFMELFPLLAGQLSSASGPRHDLRDAVMKVWNNYFPITESDKALAFNCGVILLQLGYFDEARGMFEQSQQILGPSAPNSYNLYLCALGRGRTKEAVELLRKVADLDPNFARIAADEPK